MYNNYYTSVLIVDDDSAVRFNDKTLINLVDLNTTCYEASNGSEALYEIRKMKNLPDIILLDLDMPIMNGLEFIRQFKKIQNSEKTRIVVTSSSITPEDIYVMKRLGITSFVSKPLSLPYMELIISQVHMNHYKLVPIRRHFA